MLKKKDHILSQHVKHRPVIIMIKDGLLHHTAGKELVRLQLRISSKINLIGCFMIGN